jgi:hypothetical protein
MTRGEILLGVISGLVVNEICEVSPWIARKLVRWSAYRRYPGPTNAATRAEELEAFINERPGKLFKLLEALRFVAWAIVAPYGKPGLAPRLLRQAAIPAAALVLTYGSSCVVSGWLRAGVPARRWDR